MTIRPSDYGNKADRSALRFLHRPAIFKLVPQASAFWSRIETRRKFCLTRQLISVLGPLAPRIVHRLQPAQPAMTPRTSCSKLRNWICRPTGDWTVNIAVSRNSESADLSLPLRVVKRESGLADLWPYFLFPAIWHDPVWGVYSAAPRDPTASPVEQHASS